MGFLFSFFKVLNRERAYFESTPLCVFFPLCCRPQGTLCFHPDAWYRVYGSVTAGLLRDRVGREERGAVMYLKPKGYTVAGKYLYRRNIQTLGGGKIEKVPECLLL